MVIHWFRRDLRVRDNTALNAVVAAAEEVLPVYVASEWSGEHPWTGPMRQEFLCGSLEVLARSLEARGGRLIIRRGRADEELARLAGETGAEAIYCNRDPDPFGRLMEERVAARTRVPLHALKDVAIHERDEVLTGKGEPYRVFTPYAKAWRRLAKPAVAGAPERIRTPANVASLALPGIETWGLKRTGKIVAPGEAAARERLESFVRERLGGYGAERDFPAAEGTSRLSQDLRWGLISPREVYARAMAALEQADGEGRKSIDKYVTELIWREFYFQVLWHWPRVLDEDFNPACRGVRWYEPGEEFEAWKRGGTGFPIVDAAMRQLSATGFMHNRLRMIVAMFLTKDLHVHWKHGERWFMRHLVDGEIGSNNGGWQWSAGTGADAAPYFRIQNPWIQSARYDPNGAFIKRWVPELREAPPAALAAPPEAGRCIAAGYPAAIVDHAREREVALRLFRAAG